MTRFVRFPILDGIVPTHQILLVPNLAIRNFDLPFRLFPPKSKKYKADSCPIVEGIVPMNNYDDRNITKNNMNLLNYLLPGEGNLERSNCQWKKE